MDKHWKIVNDRIPATPDEVIDILLANRGFDPEMLSADLSGMGKYLKIRNLDEAAAIAARHINQGSFITGVSDYDVDGITSIAQLSLFLRQIGYKNWAAVLPTRKEGYGFAVRALDEYPQTKLYICMDCGTLDTGPIERALASGAEVIVLDHHEVPAAPAAEKKIAPATALVNPKHPECPSYFKEFCAAGLTLLFLSRLRAALAPAHGKIELNGHYMSLAALGTVADLVPLVQGNRLITSAGLKTINKAGADGFLPMELLKQVAGVTKEVTAGIVGFYLAPRINAAGRMADPIDAYNFFMSENSTECQNLASKLNALNVLRQKEEAGIIDAIDERIAMMEAEVEDESPGRRTVVMASPDWPHGIIGICASKIQESLHYGPVILFQIDEEKQIAKGSARSISGFNLYEALTECSDLLVRWGGHEMAAGMTIEMKNFDALAERFEQIAQRHDPDIFTPRGKIDMELPAKLINRDLYESLRCMEPYGMGNPAPVFVVPNAQCVVERVFGKDSEHLKLSLPNVPDVPAVWWRANSDFSHSAGDRIDGDVIFGLDWDTYSQKPQMNIKAIERGIKNRKTSADGLSNHPYAVHSLEETDGREREQNLARAVQHPGVQKMSQQNEDRPLPKGHKELIRRSWKWIREGLVRCAENPGDRQACLDWCEKFPDFTATWREILRGKHEEMVSIAMKTEDYFELPPKALDWWESIIQNHPFGVLIAKDDYVDLLKKREEERKGLPRPHTANL